MTEYKALLRKYTGENAELLQLLTAHSEAVANKALEILRKHPELDLNPDEVMEAAMLHDIGVVACDAPSIHCHGSESYIRHGVKGAEILRQEGLEKYARVAERHTGAGITAQYIREHGLPLPARDFLPETKLEKLICYADKFFSKSRRPDDAKPVEKIRSQMAQFGSETLARFDALHSLFA